MTLENADAELKKGEKRMGQILYLECASGISGDMTAAALMDLGADRAVLDQALGSLPVKGFEVEISRVKKSGLDVCDFHVKLDEEHENHDHDMEYLFGHSHGYDESHEHGEGRHSHGEGHSREEEHSHEAHPHGHHEHRGLPEILEIINKAEMSGRAKETASKIFRILAEAEAKAHGVPAEQVHFHEVGAVDSIVDIIAVAVCLDNLDITEVIVPYVCEGSGTVRCQHGILPVPVPAVVNVAKAHGIPLRMTGMEGELVTPTGAAIVAAIRTAAGLPKEFVVKKTGIGAGKRNYERPSLLRAMLVESTEKSAEKESADTICKLETNIDDCTGEALGYVMSRLLEFGARDVYYTPVYMKKNRPAYQLSVICDEFCREELEQIIFQETTTIGIRRVRMDRTVLQREMERVTLPFGELKIKKCILPDGRERRYPEYESAVELAEENDVPLQLILDEWKRHG